MPLGIDRMEQLFRADSESRVLELILFHFCQMQANTVEQFFLGSSSFGTIDPINIKSMLLERHEGRTSLPTIKWFKAVANETSIDWNFGPRRAITFPLLGDGIFTQEGSAWKHSRSQLKPQFDHHCYEDLSVFDKPVGDLLEILGSSTGALDIQPLFFIKTHFGA